MQPINHVKEEILEMMKVSPDFEGPTALAAYLKALVIRCIKITEENADFPSQEANNALAYTSDTAFHRGHRCNYHSNNLYVAIDLCRDVMTDLRKYESQLNEYDYSYVKALLCSRLADLFYETGNIIKSENLYREALDLYQSVWDTGVLDSYECNIVVTIVGLSDIYYSILERDKEEEVLREGESLISCLTERNDLYLEDLGIINSMLMDLAKENRRPAEVEMYYRQMVEIYSSLLSEDNDKYRNEEFYDDYHSYEDVYQGEARYYDVSMLSYTRKKQLFTSLCHGM